MGEREIACARRVRNAAYELAIASVEAEIFSKRHGGQLSRLSARVSAIAKQIEAKDKPHD